MCTCLQRAQNLLSPLSATDSMACVWVVSENINGTYKNLTGFSYISEFLIIRIVSQMQLHVKQARPLTSHSPPSTSQRLGGVWDFFLFSSIRPQVCWLVSAPPWVRAWTLTSRWSCCYWLCGCGCWGHLCRIWPLYSWLCYAVLRQWQERAAEKNSRKSWWEIRGMLSIHIINYG